MLSEHSIAGGTPRRNLELKARLQRPAAAHAEALRLGATAGGVLRQRDTYFHVPAGRLKLREIAGEGAELIFYLRDETGPDRWSDYQVTPVADPHGMVWVLTSALGMRGVVVKQRTLYWWEECRIHVDQVEQLGAFLEFEVRSAGDERDDKRRLKELRAAFGVEDADLISGSYADLLGL